MPLIPIWELPTLAIWQAMNVSPIYTDDPFMWYLAHARFFMFQDPGLPHQTDQDDEEARGRPVNKLGPTHKEQTPSIAPSDPSSKAVDGDNIAKSEDRSPDPGGSENGTVLPTTPYLTPSKSSFFAQLTKIWVA